MFDFKIRKFVLFCLSTTILITLGCSKSEDSIQSSKNVCAGNTVQSLTQGTSIQLDKIPYGSYHLKSATAFFDFNMGSDGATASYNIDPSQVDSLSSTCLTYSQSNNFKSFAQINLITRLFIDTDSDASVKRTNILKLDYSGQSFNFERKPFDISKLDKNGQENLFRTYIRQFKDFKILKLDEFSFELRGTASIVRDNGTSTISLSQIFSIPNDMRADHTKMWQLQKEQAQLEKELEVLKKTKELLNATLDEIERLKILYATNLKDLQSKNPPEEEEIDDPLFCSGTYKSLDGRGHFEIDTDNQACIIGLDDYSENADCNLKNNRSFKFNSKSVDGYGKFEDETCEVLFINGIRFKKQK